MSAKYYTTTHTHPYNWDTVASAIFVRYPNPFASHVLSEDTLHRELQGPNNSLLYSRRFLTKTNKLPKWGERFFANLKKYVPLVEESWVDPANKTVITYTRNVGLSHFMTAIEKVCYKPNPDNPSGETLAIKEAWVESRLYGLRSAIKSFGIERFKTNCSRATDGFNHVLQHLQQRQHHYLSQQQWQKLRARSGNRVRVHASETVAEAEQPKKDR